MADTPFWKQAPSEDESDGQAPAEPVPTLPGKTSVIDPESGEWRPIKRGETFTVGGHEFNWAEGPIATAIFHDGDGNELGKVHVPFDPTTQLDPTTQQPNDDVLEDARRYFLGMEHMRSIVKDDAIDALVRDLHKPGASGERSLAVVMVETVADILKGSLKLTVTDDDGSDGLTPEQLDALAAEGERLFDEQLPELVRGIAETEVDGRTFWQSYARDIIATATLDARDAVAEEWGGHEAVEALDDDAFAAFEERVFEAYRTGPYLAGAMLSLSRSWTGTLGEIVAGTMSQLAESEEGKTLSETILKAARKSLSIPEPATSSAETPPTFTPAFDDAGYGRADNSIIAIGARRALSAEVTRWNIDVEAWPTFTHENGSGKALYSPSRSHFPTARDAMRAVESYSPAHVAMLKYIQAKHLANSANKTSGPYGGFYLSVEEFLAFRGIQKQQAGGYRTEDQREVVELIEALQRIEVTGNVEGYEKGKRGKSSLTIRSPLIVVSQTITQKGMPNSPERPVAWYLRAGDWAAELERFGLQYAVMTKSLLQLNLQNNMNAFKLGTTLSEEYRIRTTQQSWQQPYRVSKLLADAEMEVDRKHAGRFRKRIEDALDVLCNPVDMQGTPLIESWRYRDVVEAKGRGWLDRWLDSGIIITPHTGYLQRYASMGKRRRAPKKLAG